MSYQRAFSTLGCTELSLGEVARLAERHGSPGVELRGLGGTLDLPKYLEQSLGPPGNAIASQIVEPVRIFALDTSFKLSDEDTGNREALLRFVPWAEALKVRWLRVFDGGSSGNAGELERAAATLAWWRELRARNGWKCDVMIETHDSLFTAAAIGRFVALVPDAAVLWDSHHTWRRGSENPMKTWNAIKGNVVHVHVKDSVARPSARHPFTYVLPGDGEFPAETLFSALRADQFAGPVSLEWEKLWHPYLAPIEEALTQANARGWW